MGAQESLQLDCCSDRDDPATRRMLSRSKKGGASPPEPTVRPKFGPHHSSASEKHTAAGHAALMKKFPSKDLKYPSGERCIVVEPVLKKKAHEHTPSEMEVKPIKPYLSPAREHALHKKETRKRVQDAPVSMVGEWDRLTNDSEYSKIRSEVRRKNTIDSIAKAKQDVNKQYKGNFMNPFPAMSMKKSRAIGREMKDYTTLSDDEREHERQWAARYPKRKEDPMYDPHRPQANVVFRQAYGSE